MNYFQKFLAYLSDSSKDVQERMFALLSFISQSGMLIAIGTGLIIGENIESIVSMAVCFVVFAILAAWGLKFHRIGIVTGIVSTILVFILLPVLFFTSGGIYGGTPIWFVFVIVYISMIMRGRSKVVFYIATLAVTVTCWYIQYVYPELVIRHDEKAVFLDSLGSLLVVSFVLTILVWFQSKLYQKENAESERQKKEIEKLIEGQNSFFSSMSHEIRTPINTIIGLNEIILRQNASEEINEDAENIKAAGNMLLHLINDILDVSKMESGRMELSPRPYNTGEMLSELVGMLWIRAHEKGLDFKMDVSPDLPEQLDGDEVRIKQVLINVVNNAIKYTQEGSVELSIQYNPQSEKRGVVIYSVTDTGIGIKKENIPYLFTAFTRVEEDKNRYIEGTGLGLSIVKRLVDLMGGKITVNSVYTKGSTFVIEIPQRVVGSALIGDYNPGREHSFSRTVEYHQSFEAPEARVLIVDDTDANLMVARKLLKETKVQITVASSGFEALKLTLDNTYDVIFMDHLMPEMNGIECMHRIKAQVGGRSRDSRIVCLTAKADRDSEALYAKEGFDGYLVKPVNGKDLESELYRMLPDSLITKLISDKDLVEESVSWVQEVEKKSSVAVTSESVADIPPELIREYNIQCIPYMVMTDDGVFQDDVEIGARGAINFLEEEKGTIFSKAPDDKAYESFFAGALMSANNVIHIALSDSINGRSGYEAASEAARAFDNVFVVDSSHLSTGHGLVAVEAARMVREGMDTEKILKRLEYVKLRINTAFVVDSLEYLAGRNLMKTVFADITKAFMIRPMIVLKNGRMKITHLFMGGKTYSWKKCIGKALAAKGNIDKSVVFIVYAGMDKKYVEQIRSAILKRVPFENVYEVQASAAIAVNSGPDSFGLAFMEKG